VKARTGTEGFRIYFYSSNLIIYLFEAAMDT